MVIRLMPAFNFSSLREGQRKKKSLLQGIDQNVNFEFHPKEKRDYKPLYIYKYRGEREKETERPMFGGLHGIEKQFVFKLLLLLMGILIVDILRRKSLTMKPLWHRANIK